MLLAGKGQGEKGRLQSDQVELKLGLLARPGSETRWLQSDQVELKLACDLARRSAR